MREGFQDRPPIPDRRRRPVLHLDPSRVPAETRKTHRPHCALNPAAMNQPDLFDLAPGFSVGPGRRHFAPKPTPAGCARVLLKCTVPRCKFCRAVDVPSSTQPPFTAGAPPRVILDAGALIAARSASKCNAHPAAYLDAHPIQGTHSAARLCDARCTSATGPVCVCSCGGANHGCAWL